MDDNKVWVIGAGEMAVEYMKVLNDLKAKVVVIGRSESSCEKLKPFNCEIVSGGLTNFLSTKPEIPEKVIVAVGIEALKDVTIELLNYGVNQILLEKPGVGYAKEIDEIIEVNETKNAKILLAYNRRYYASVMAAERIISEDGGVSSFNFEFTEWSHVIKDLEKHPVEHQNWFLGNSTHIIDTAFFLGGLPKDLSSYVTGENELTWHTSSSNYAGAGITENGALFCYHANWQAPGRWVIEILTKKHRLVFKPVEKLQIQEIGSVAVNPVEGIDYDLDEKYKPGLFLQTRDFLTNNFSRFCDIYEQEKMINNFYLKMSNY